MSCLGPRWQREVAAELLSLISLNSIKSFNSCLLSAALSLLFLLLHLFDFMIVWCCCLSSLCGAVRPAAAPNPPVIQTTQTINHQIKLRSSPRQTIPQLILNCCLPWCRIRLRKAKQSNQSILKELIGIVFAAAGGVRPCTFRSFSQKQIN